MTKIEYSDKVYRYLHDMKVGTIEELEFMPNEIIPSVIAKAYFVDIVKSFIDIDGGRQAGFYIEFSNSYAKIRKCSYSVITAPLEQAVPETSILPPKVIGATVSTSNQAVATFKST